VRGDEEVEAAKDGSTEAEAGEAAEDGERLCSAGCGGGTALPD